METLQFQIPLVMSGISLLLLMVPRYWFSSETWYELPKLKEINPRLSRAGIYPTTAFLFMIVGIVLGLPWLGWKIVPGFHGFAIFLSLLNIFHASFALSLGVYPVMFREFIFDKLKIVYIYKEGISVRVYGAFVTFASVLMISIAAFLLWLAALMN
jgi:hypothetical protein